MDKIKREIKLKAEIDDSKFQELSINGAKIKQENSDEGKII